MIETTIWPNLIGKMSPEEFFGKFWSKKPLHLKASAQGVSSRFALRDFNDILSFQRLDYPRSRVMHNGQMLPPETYTFRRSVMRGTVSAQFLDVVALNNFLSMGANLIVNGIDEMNRKIRDTCHELAHEIGNHVSANAYFACGSEGAFPKHWDDHEGIIVQCHGQKKWAVFGQTRRYPLSDDVEGNLEPSDDLIWEGLLECGDFLYVPRGYWHRVEPVNSESLHLTFGVEPPTARDWFTWVSDQCLNEEIVRKNLPHPLSSENQEECFDTIRNILIEKISSSPFENFFTEHRGRLRPQPMFSLPYNFESSELSKLVFRAATFASPSLVQDEKNKHIHLFAFDRNWTFKDSFQNIALLIVERRQFTLQDAIKKVPNEDKNSVEPLIRSLLHAALIEVVI